MKQIKHTIVNICEHFRTFPRTDRLILMYIHILNDFAWKYRNSKAFEHIYYSVSKVPRAHVRNTGFNSHLIFFLYFFLKFKFECYHYALHSHQCQYVYLSSMSILDRISKIKSEQIIGIKNEWKKET